MNTIKYDIDAENKTITGTYTFDRKEFVLNKLADFNTDVIAIGLLPEADIVTITAKAVCQEGDDFSEEYGKRLVEAKIYAIKHDKVLKSLKMLYDNAEKLMNSTVDVGMCHFKKREHINKDLREYFKLERR